jgi:hypothetical protein
MKRIQVDEIWSFTYAKQRNAGTAKGSWLVGGRDGQYALAFMNDLRSRLANHVQITSMVTRRTWRPWKSAVL